MDQTTPQALRTALVTLSLILGVTLAGCAGPEVKPPSGPELNGVSQAVLKEAVYLGTLLKRCAELDEQLNEQADRLEQRWLEHNGALLAGADDQYSNMLTRETYNYMEQPLALEAAQLTQKARQRALDELKFETRTQSNRILFCQRRLEEMAQQPPTLDLGGGQRTELTVQSLTGIQPDTQPKLDEVPKLAAHIDFTQDPGPSYHQRLRDLQADCSEAELLVIDHNWPSEAYGAYCGGSPLEFITCQWGECSSQ